MGENGRENGQENGRRLHRRSATSIGWFLLGADFRWRCRSDIFHVVRRSDLGFKVALWHDRFLSLACRLPVIHPQLVAITDQANDDIRNFNSVYLITSRSTVI